MQENWLTGHTSYLHAKWCGGKLFSQKMWVMGRDKPQDHENKVSKPSAIFMINTTQQKPKND